MKMQNSKALVPCLLGMLAGFQKVDPPTMKKMLVKVDMQELLVTAGMECIATELTKAVGDLFLTAFHYLL